MPDDKFDEAALSDMCGELCNQIMGRAKQQFLKKKSMTFEITVPTVLSDPFHILDYKSVSPVLVIPFKLEKIEAIFLEFCLEINDNYDPVAPEKLQVMVEEGQFIQF
jgi:CheY-specific phosphatase CheX